MFCVPSRWVEYSSFFPSSDGGGGGCVDLLPRFAKMAKVASLLLQSGASIDLVIVLVF